MADPLMPDEPDDLIGATKPRPIGVRLSREQAEASDLFAAILEEPDDGLHFRSHRTFGEMCSFGKVLLGFG